MTSNNQKPMEDTRETGETSGETTGASEFYMRICHVSSVGYGSLVQQALKTTRDDISIAAQRGARKLKLPNSKVNRFVAKALEKEGFEARFPMMKDGDIEIGWQRSVDGFDQE
jgi:hypothetical protein